MHNLHIIRSGIASLAIVWSMVWSASLAAPTAASAAIRYTLTDLGLDYGVAYAVNDSGQIAGYAGPDGHAFVTARAGGAVTDLGVPGIAYAINNAGHAAGVVDNGNGSYSMFWWDGTMALVGGPGQAYAINGRDQVSGYISGPGPGGYGTVDYPSLWAPASGMAPTQIGPYDGRARAIDDIGRIAGFVSLKLGENRAGFLTGPDGASPTTIIAGLTVGAAVDNAGRVVGWLRPGSIDPYEGGARAYMSGPDGGALTALGTLGGNRSAAFSINDAGQVVGYSDVAPGSSSDVQHAFLYEYGQMLDLNDLIDPGSEVMLYEARGISNSGYIAASGITSDGHWHAYLLTPLSVPEPSGPVLLTSGAACLLALTMWRRARPKNKKTPP